MCSRTRMVSGTFATCSMAPLRIRVCGSFGLPPKTVTVPESGRASPRNNFTAVVLSCAVGAEESD